MRYLAAHTENRLKDILELASKMVSTKLLFSFGLNISIQ